MTSDDRMRSGTILAVCTGNLCRSPVVEWLLRLGLNSRWPAASSALPIASAGTNAALGQPIPLSFATRLASIGAEPSTFAPRQVTAEMVAGAELVITATRAHRATVVQLHPRAVQYTFTLRELARLAAAAQPGDQAPIEPLARLRSFVTTAASVRGADMPGDPTADDIRDPFGGNDARYAQVWSSLVEATSEILDALCPVDFEDLDVRECAVGMTAQLSPVARVDSFRAKTRRGRRRKAQAETAPPARRARSPADPRRGRRVDRLQRASGEGQSAARGERRHGAAIPSGEWQRRRRTSQSGEPAARGALSASRDRRPDLGARAMDASGRKQRRGDYQGGVGRR